MNKWDNMIEKYELFIFDFDGTLYEDTDHFDFYAEQLKQQVASEQQATFMKTYQAVKQGNHVVAVGKAYDVQRDVLLTLDPLTLQVTAVHDWQEQAWDEQRIKETYPEQVTFDFEHIVAIGDGWWLPFVVAKHFGVADTYSCYLKTKEFMATDQFEISKTPGLKRGLLRLKEEKQIVLVTNSHQEDVDRLLAQLELQGIFDDVIYSAKKPLHTKKHFTQLLEKYQVAPEHVISIGDNFLNEAAPALSLGMDAMLIQPQEQGGIQHERVMVVKSLAEVF